MAALALEALRATVANGTEGGGHFDCVHMRRRDFVADHREEESVAQYAARAASKLQHVRGAGGRRTGTSSKARARQRKSGAAVREASRLPVYLASDVAEEAETQQSFARHFGRVLTLRSVFPRSALDSFTSTRQLSRLAPGSVARDAALAREMRLGNVDQLVCSAASRFIGNKWSSFTHHVCYLREQRGADCDGSDIYDREVDPGMAYV